MKVLVVTSAGAARATKRLPALRQALPESATVRHRVTRCAEELTDLVGEPTWKPDDLLVIHGGDGSVQHALTVLLSRCPPARLPRLACLPGGTTNMTAFDINSHRSFRRCLETLAHAARVGASRVQARPVVRVCTAGGAEADPHYGLFFGIGTIVQGIEYFRDRLRGRGTGHELAAGIALGRAVWGIVRGEPSFAQPLAVTMDAPGLGPDRGAPAGADLSVRFLLVTVLGRLFLGIRPYWGTRTGPLKATLVETRARHLVASMPRLLRGRPDVTMTPEEGYHSSNVTSLELRFRGNYTLDGELFANAGGRMRVSATEPVRFVPL